MFQNGTDGHPLGVDIAIPCYQYGRFLRDCVTSVLTQEFRDVRVLIIDNASTDNSLEVAQQLAAEDPRVEVVAHRHNLGHHASFNEGIDWARSKYFMILCADDLLAPGCLSRAVSFMEKHPDVHLTHGRALSISNDDPVPPIAQPTEANWQVWPGRAFLQGVCRAGGRPRIRGGTVVVRTSVQKRVGYYRPELPYTDDLEIWLRFAIHGAVGETDAVQAIIRYHSMMRSPRFSGILYYGLDWDLQVEAALESFFANEGASVPEAKSLHRTLRRKLAECAYWNAWSNLVRGDPRQSLRHCKFAFTRYPMTILYGAPLVPPLVCLFRRPGIFNRILQGVIGCGARDWRISV
jgi:glycosyltransferase involved in cell wall biosynthesis